MPVRWLIGPGLLPVGIGLLLMRGIAADSSWTHLIPGFVVAGLGSGMVNPPLASTAVGVVEPRDAGMASGINTTFRQVGIATAIAAFGTIFASELRGATPLTIASHYATATNELLLIAAIVAILAAAAAVILIRQRDFVQHVPAPEPADATASDTATDIGPDRRSRVRHPTRLFRGPLRNCLGLPYVSWRRCSGARLRVTGWGRRRPSVASAPRSTHRAK